MALSGEPAASGSFGAGLTFPRSPVDLLPSPWDRLGPPIQGCGRPGPLGEQEAE